MTPSNPLENGSADALSLPDLVQKLAAARQQIAVLQLTRSQLVDTSEQVAAYVAHGQELTAARRTERTAYASVVGAAVAAYDGDNRQPHPDVAISLYREAAVTHHGAALLWLLGHATDAIDLDDAKRMNSAIQAVGRVTPITLRRRQALAIVEELFVQPAFEVSGVVVVDGNEQAVQHVVLEAACVLDARAAAEAALTRQFQPHAWTWQSPPSVQQIEQQLDQLVVSTPQTVLKPRIAKELSQQQPV